MKVQCSCGAKYEFDITPVMRTNPIRFVCPACGVDASDFIDGLVRRELGQAAKPSGVPVDVPQAATGPEAPVAVEVPPPPGPVMTLHRDTPAVSAAETETPPLSEPLVCSKHPNELATAKCFICSKPICPKCLRLFGYLCSPLCKARADSRGIQVPVYAGQRALVEKRRWRAIGLAAAALGVVAIGLLGGWIWYAWIGSVPKPVFSVRFPQPAYAGQSVICGKDRDQIIFLHGGTLARHDLKQHKEIWSLELLDRKVFAELANAQMQALQQRNSKLRDQGREDLPRLPDQEQLNESAERAAEGQLALHVRGQNIWVVAPGKVARYDWETGKLVKEVTAPAGSGGLISRGDEVLLLDTAAATPVVTHLNLANCESHSEEVASPEARVLAGTARSSARPTDSMGGLPVGTPGKDMDKALDPAKVAAQAQRLGTPAKTALPAVLANSMNQERLLAELNDDGRPKPPPENAIAAPSSSFSLIPDQDGFVQFSVKLVESRIVQRSAMKTPPARSALAGSNPGLDTTAATSELLNQMQRERGGEMIEENLSRYQVTLQGPGNTAGWTGEVIGPPRLFPLQTVNMLAANNQIIVFDKANKELWHASLIYNVGSSPGESGEREAGLGPCVERKGSLYVFDEGKLTTFNLATGTVRWSLPSVGISGILFDDQDMIYVNSTTASPDTIKYKRQIDVSDKVNPIALQVDPRNGAIRWQAESIGRVSYASGKFIYAVESFEPSGEDDSPFSSQLGSEPKPYLHIRRLNPKDGREMWVHSQERAPLDVGFDQNTIRLVFKKEVQVLKFFAF